MALKLISVINLITAYSPSAHYDEAYAHSPNDVFNNFENWMSRMDDNRLMSELALPGTHNTAAFGNHLPGVSTQALDFDRQLTHGIRVFDIRVRHTGNSFALHHGSAFLGKMFGDCLSSVRQFLRDQPTETVVIILRKEEKDNKNNNRTLTDTLEWYLQQYSDIYKKANLRVRLGNVRGKFILVDNNSFGHKGIPFYELNKQDDWMLESIWKLYDKWTKVRSHLDNARNGSKRKFFINFLSGSNPLAGVFPHFVASGHVTSGTSDHRLLTGEFSDGSNGIYPDFPRDPCFLGVCSIAFEGTNILTRDYLRDRYKNKGRSVGIIMADYPGTSLIKQIIDDNDNH